MSLLQAYRTHNFFCWWCRRVTYHFLIYSASGECSICHHENAG
jgi:hypothetical protein